MKKIVALALMLIALSTSAFSVPLIEIADGNMDEFDIINANGLKVIDGFAAESDGYLIRVKNEPVEAISPLGNLKLSEETLLAIIETEYSSPILYLVHGTMSLYPDSLLRDAMTIYTPTSRFNINGIGEYVFHSTDDREEFYNFTDSDAYAFNSITGQEYTVPALHGVDFLKKNGNPFGILEEQYYENSLETIKKFDKLQEEEPAEEIVEVEKTIEIPLPPVFSSEISRELDRPLPPQVSVASSELYSDTPEPATLSLVSSELYYEVPESPALSIAERELYFEVPDAPSFAAIEQSVYEYEEIAVPEIKNEEITVITELDEVEEEPLLLVDEEQADVSTSPIIAKANPTKGFDFDISMLSRAYFDSEQRMNLSLALIPSFRINSLYFALNLDAVAISKYKDNSSFEDWFGYIANTIDYLRYRSLNEVFDITISRDKTFAGDSVGLYGGYSHIYDRETDALSAQLDINTNALDLTLFAEDLTLDRFSSAKGSNVAFLEAKLLLSKSYPMTLSLSLIGDFSNSDIKSINLYPEASLYLPFHDKNNNKVGMNIGLSTVLAKENMEFDPIKNGLLVSLSIPMKFQSMTIAPGLYYSSAEDGPSTARSVHYMSINSIGYEPKLSTEPQLTLAANFGIEKKNFGIKALVSADLMINSMRFNPENSLFALSSHLDFDLIKIEAGLKAQNFTTIEAWKENASIHGSLETTINGISSKITAGVQSLKNKDFYLSFVSTASLNAKKADTKGRASSIFSIDLDTGFTYSKENGASFNVAPIFTLGSSKYALSLTAPVSFSFAEDKVLLINDGDSQPWWLFGSDEETLSTKLYKAITGSFELINYIKLGGVDTSRAFLRLERNTYLTDSLFREYGMDALNLTFGLNLPNLRLKAFVGNIESPYLGEVAFGIHPINLASFSINIKVPFELYFSDLQNYSMFFYPQLMLNIPLVKNHLELSAYASGTVAAEYVDNKVDQSSIKFIYDFENKQAHSYIAGAMIDLSLSRFSLRLEGGVRNGLLTPDMYNAFTAKYNQKPSLENPSTPSSYFAMIESGIELDHVSLSLGYSIPDFTMLYDGPEAITEDLFSLKAEARINDSLTIFSSVARKNFASIFFSDTEFMSIINSCDTLYSIGLTLDLGNASINALLSSEPIEDGFNGIEFMNAGASYIPAFGTTPTFSLSTRIGF